MGEERAKSNGRDIIVIGGSAGAIDAIQKILSGLGKDFKASVFVVIHISPLVRSVLPELLSRKTGLNVVHPKNYEKIEAGSVYIAPPDFHMVLANSHIELQRGPRENRHRPAVDPLFRSAALAYGPRVIGVIITGSLDDGTAGLQAVKQCGGVAVVQHPKDAEWPGMPENALKYVEVDYCVPLRKLPALLGELLNEDPAGRKTNDCDVVILEQELSEKNMNPKSMEKQLGPPSGFVCPECNGPLWEVNEGKLTSFRCLVGHHFSPESFLAEEGEALERALWVAVKTLEERASLLRRLAARSAELNENLTTDMFREKAGESEEHANTIRKIVKKLQS